jgi:hypothetical protein
VISITLSIAAIALLKSLVLAWQFEIRTSVLVELAELFLSLTFVFIVRTGLNFSRFVEQLKRVVVTTNLVVTLAQKRKYVSVVDFGVCVIESLPLISKSLPFFFRAMVR